MSILLDPAVAELADELLALPDADLAAFMARMSGEQLAMCERALATKAAIGWRATPVTMAHHFGAMKLWRYSVYLGEKFRQAVTGESKRQLWSLEARFGKSLVASQWGPAWALDRDPTTRLILTSYGDKLADENSDAVRAILRTHAKDLRVDLRRDRQQIDRFRTTEGGGLLAAGIDSAMSGFPADGAILDDPFRDWQQAHSEARRNHVENQYKAVVRLRLETDDSWVIIVHNRWHEDDLQGRLIQQMQDGTGEEWDVVRLATVAEAADPNSSDYVARLPDPLGRVPGEILEPERFSAEAVAARTLALGSYLSSGLQQQRPTPAEGGEVKRAWFRLEDQMPSRWDQALIAWDPKLKDNERGDYVVGQVWGRTGKDCWLVDGIRGKWDLATTVNAIALMAVRHPYARLHVIENAGNGPEVMEALRSPSVAYEVSVAMASQLGMIGDERDKVTLVRRRGLGGLLPHTPKGPKAVRMRSVIPYIEAGDVHLNARWPGLGAFMDEVAGFPTASFDDQYDCASMALARLHRAGVHRTRLTGSALQQTSAATV